ncbi:sunset domain-containing protein [Pseudonocardia sp. TRM90224]|uniref:sunset domain-containing protein n=1 Tax=Pseudonocardia sp. TRM90224 TaxID=2812678 RepID=UPI001E447051|nr:hypothetical protein [Pseudonocardia sp. TRM90224]
MAEDSTPRRRRRGWAVLLVVAGAGGWYLWSRRTAAADVSPWPEREPVRVVPPAGSTGASTNGAVRTEARPAAEPVPAATPKPSPRPRPKAEPKAKSEPKPQPIAATPEGGAPAGPDGAAPGPEYTIKGNAGSMLFHPPSSPYYKRTKAEVWFRTPEEATAAGFTEWTPKKRASK